MRDADLFWRIDTERMKIVDTGVPETEWSKTGSKDVCSGSLCLSMTPCVLNHVLCRKFGVFAATWTLCETVNNAVLNVWKMFYDTGTTLGRQAASSVDRRDHDVHKRNTKRKPKVIEMSFSRF